MSRRGLAVLGLAAAGGAGYYLYSAGGDPKAAEKHFEADAHKASAKIRGELPGRGKEVEKRGEAYLNQAESQVNQAAADTRRKLEQGKAEAEKQWQQGKADVEKKYAEGKKEAGDLLHRTEREINKGIDTFDKTVEKKAAEAKSGLSSWFGGK
ncbi:hypothetical protein LTR64_000213 [Lithohypha guttulata]|uniref:Calcofluor white hypersensitive protein n=1 Tax=Lithohypha guttulata TaxID=1690604 RepID=A0AAN7STV6_9EURO|nr:hypothetical protein LTR51_007575 [Lithohypha guttulata]KAK5081342.1 hypothetical protein LTR05_008136 [Lithohypha guttulata]